VRAASIPGYRRSHVGHAIGLDLYEPLLLRPAEDAVLKENMGLNVECPYYELEFAGGLGMGLSQRSGSVLAAIGNTPLLNLSRVAAGTGCTILAKAEFLNAGGSIKSRTAYGMIIAGIQDGRITADTILAEATSGNQGIGIAMVAAALGLKARIVMPENMSAERKALIGSYGAEVVLTPAGRDIGEAIDLALAKVRALAEADPRVVFLSQFTNPANPETHRRTTAREILDQAPGAIHAFVSGIGTGGTITGVGEVLKGALPGVRVAAAEPENAAILSGGKIGHHVQQGIGDGLIPDVLNRDIIDQLITVSDEDAVATARRLAAEEGCFVGVSSGTNVFAALELCRQLGPGHTIMTLLPDTGERYISMGIW
jgi:cysteine synthase A